MSALAKHTHGRVEGVRGTRLVKVLEPWEAAASALPDGDILLWTPEPGDGACGDIIVCDLRDDVVRPGDVLRLREGASLVSVVYRRGSRANVLFATERCNSLCLMCSQPPRDVDDNWRVDELLRMVALVDRDEVQLGVTGGEPTLMGSGLARVLAACRAHLPDTELHILTNGRRFAERHDASAWVAAGGDRTTWAVPLAGDTPGAHDHIMGARGGFQETLEGLAELARLGARVEIRVVLHALSIPRLTALARFIYRRLPFVEHVALMGLEPMGFAKRNREQLWIDPADYVGELQDAVGFLSDRGVPVSIYNLPHCVLPRGLWRFARQSISDWKNTYPPECAGCAAQAACAGFFASAGPAWRSRRVSPIGIEEMAA
jgi:His-Xaa-Ser system radical SAM maturase HxsC